MTSKERGEWGEALAVEYLTSQGYAILEQNWKMGHYEVDIIVQKDNFIAFVEVKTRKDESNDPVSAVNKRKRSRIVASADVYLRHYDLPFEYRFDIIAITGSPEKYNLEHIPNAYYPSLKSHSFSFRM